MSIEQSLEVTSGFMFLILGLSFLLRPKEWVDWFEGVRIGGLRMALALGMMHLFFGALFVALHQVWSGWGMVLTVIGLWAMAEGTLYLLFPACIGKMIGWLWPCRNTVIRVSALITIILAAALIYPYCSERFSL